MKLFFRPQAFSMEHETPPHVSIGLGVIEIVLRLKVHFYNAPARNIQIRHHLALLMTKTPSPPHYKPSYKLRDFTSKNVTGIKGLIEGIDILDIHIVTNRGMVQDTFVEFTPVYAMDEDPGQDEVGIKIEEIDDSIRELVIRADDSTVSDEPQDTMKEESDEREQEETSNDTGLFPSLISQISA